MVAPRNPWAEVTQRHPFWLRRTEHQWKGFQNGGQRNESGYNVIARIVYFAFLTHWEIG